MLDKTKLFDYWRGQLASIELLKLASFVKLKRAGIEVEPYWRIRRLDLIRAADQVENLVAVWEKGLDILIQAFKQLEDANSAILPPHVAKLSLQMFEDIDDLDVLSWLVRRFSKKTPSLQPFYRRLRQVSRATQFALLKMPELFQAGIPYAQIVCATTDRQAIPTSLADTIIKMESFLAEFG